MAQQSVTVSTITPTVDVGSAAASTTEIVTSAPPLASDAEMITGTIDTKAATPAGVVAKLTDIQINTTTPLTGGGDLSADRTIAVSAASATAAGVLAVPSIFNASVANQGPAFDTDTYLTGSSCAIPNGRLQAKTMYRCRFTVDKTAAGTAAVTVAVRIGTAGAIGDTARCALTWGLQTAAGDEGVYEILCTFRTVGSGTSAVLQATGQVRHRLSVTGLAPVASGVQYSTSSGFDSTVADSLIGLSLNGGASAAFTVKVVQSELCNLV